VNQIVWTEREKHGVSNASCLFTRKKNVKLDRKVNLQMSKKLSQSGFYFASFSRSIHRIISCFCYFGNSGVAAAEAALLCKYKSHQSIQNFLSTSVSSFQSRRWKEDAWKCNWILISVPLIELQSGWKENDKRIMYCNVILHTYNTKE